MGDIDQASLGPDIQYGLPRRLCSSCVCCIRGIVFGHLQQSAWLILAQTDRNFFDSHNKKPEMDRQELESSPVTLSRTRTPSVFLFQCHSTAVSHILHCCLLISKRLL